MKNNIIYCLLSVIVLSACSKSGADSSAAAGSNGSLTRFITAGDYLYVVDNSNLHTYSIINPAVPQLKNTTSVGFAIQTVLAYKNQLFIGSSNNMFIYSISNPEKPSLVSQVAYFVRGKDPVIANDSVAYSTVRNGFGPGGTLNVFNIKNSSQPLILSTIGMQSPYGLGMKDSALYICDAEAGLKLYNIKDNYRPIFKTTINNTEVFYDVIVSGNVLICYIKGGLCFIDIANPLSPVIIKIFKG